uniref:Uncharacterized protein n=1 Tax=Onchocerca volvulus TaxID=6282 RepID=A0A8R1XNE9_ONCVO
MKEGKKEKKGYLFCPPGVFVPAPARFKSRQEENEDNRRSTEERRELFVTTITTTTAVDSFKNIKLLEKVEVEPRGLFHLC